MQTDEGSTLSTCGSRQKRIAIELAGAFALSAGLNSLISYIDSPYSFLGIFLCCTPGFLLATWMTTPILHVSPETAKDTPA